MFFFFEYELHTLWGIKAWCIKNDAQQKTQIIDFFQMLGKGLTLFHFENVDFAYYYLTSQALQG